MAVEGFYQEVLPSCRVKSDEGWSRGRKALHQALQLLSARDMVPGGTCEPLEVPAKAVRP